LIRTGILPLFTVLTSTGALNVTTTGVVVATLLAPLDGLMLNTVILVPSVAVPVLKLLVNAGATFPLTSATPLTLTV
jgi:hypothetical protein